MEWLAISVVLILSARKRSSFTVAKTPEWTQWGVVRDRKIGLIFIWKVPRKGHEQKKKRTLEVKVKPSRPPQARGWRISSVTGWKCFFHVSSKTITRGYQLKVCWPFIRLTSSMLILFFRPKLRPSAYFRHTESKIVERGHTACEATYYECPETPCFFASLRFKYSLQ